MSRRRAKGFQGVRGSQGLALQRPYDLAQARKRSLADEVKRYSAKSPYERLHVP